MLLLPPDGRRIGALQRQDLHILTAGLLHPASAVHTGVVGAGWVCRIPFASAVTSTRAAHRPCSCRSARHHATIYFVALPSPHRPQARLARDPDLAVLLARCFSRERPHRERPLHMAPRHSRTLSARASGGRSPASKKRVPSGMTSRAAKQRSTWARRQSRIRSFRVRSGDMVCC